VRGLTDQERTWLTEPNAFDLETCVRVCAALEARGLVAGASCACGGPPDCPCPEEDVVADLTPIGELALRLDAAARAMGGAHG
jgi:hypothetical protein